MSVSGEILHDIPVLTGSALSQNMGVLHHAGDHSVRKFLVRERVPCTADLLLYHLDFSLNFRDLFTEYGSVEGDSLVL